MKYYYYSKEKNLPAVVNFRMVQNGLFDSLQRCVAATGIDGENRQSGYVYTLEQVEKTGENINHGYKSSLPMRIVGCVRVKDIYAE